MSDGSNIVSLRGDPISGRPTESVVELLEDALASAKAGEISAVGIVMVSPSGRVTPWWANPGVDGHNLISGGFLLQRAVASGLTEGQ